MRSRSDSSSISSTCSISISIFAKTYTFWGGLIGGCFLTMSTHGTDQFLVQRYLCTDKPRAAITALMTSGAVVLAQFIGFLFIGVLLFAFYTPYKMTGYEAATGAFPFPSGDKVFPDFITQKMPTGLSGLVVAAIFAAALSSSLNSIAATAVNDIYKPFAKDATDKHLMRVAGILTVVVGIVQIAIAIGLKDVNSSALGLALAVASLINGPILGVFLVGAFLKRAKEIHALTGMIVSISSNDIRSARSKQGRRRPGHRVALVCVDRELITLIVAFVSSLVIGSRTMRLSKAMSSNRVLSVSYPCVRCIPWFSRLKPRKTRKTRNHTKSLCVVHCSSAASSLAEVTAPAFHRVAKSQITSASPRLAWHRVEQRLRPRTVREILESRRQAAQENVRRRKGRPAHPRRHQRAFCESGQHILQSI